MTQVPLYIESYIANSIARFVLNNPDITDTVEAYNKWACSDAVHAGFRIDEKMTLFCLEQFDGCLHRLSPEFLKELLRFEEKLVQ